MRLIDMARNSPRRLVVPLLGYPGARLTNSTLRQNGFNAELHFRSVSNIVERFSPDAVFFMMDLSLEAGALGLPVRYPLNESPTVEEHPVKRIEDLGQFKVLDPMNDARIRSFIRVMELMKKHLSIPCGGYVIGPFTLAGLMMGATEITMATILDPDLVRYTIEFSTQVCRRYAKALADAGADMIAILEPTAVLLSPQAFPEFCGNHISEIISEMKPMMILHICGNTTHLLSEMSKTGAQGLSLDAAVDFPSAVHRVDPEVVLIGNIDPVGVMVQESPDQVRERVRNLLNAMFPYENFILSTGCDLPLETPFENIDAFMDEGRRQMNGGIHQEDEGRLQTSGNCRQQNVGCHRANGGSRQESGSCCPANEGRRQVKAAYCQAGENRCEADEDCCCQTRSDALMI